MTEATLEYASPIDEAIAEAERTPAPQRPDLLDEFAQRRKEARAKIAAAVVKVVDGEPVDAVELRDALSWAEMRQADFESLVAVRRSRVDAVATLKALPAEQQRAAELKQEHAQAAERYRAEEARRIELIAESDRALAEINQEGIRLYGEYAAIDRSVANAHGYATRVLIDTADPAIQARIDRLQEESRGIAHKTSDSTNITNRANALEKRAAFWRGWLERTERIPIARPQMPAGLKREDYATWRWFFNTDPNISPKNLQSQRESFIAGLERKAQEERDSLKQFEPLYRRQREITAEIQRLEVSKLDV